MYAQQASAPTMYPHMGDDNAPEVPSRFDDPALQQKQALISHQMRSKPELPPRMDKTPFSSMNNEPVKVNIQADKNF